MGLFKLRREEEKDRKGLFFIGRELLEKKDDKRKFIILAGVAIAGLLGAKVVHAMLKPKDIVRKKRGEKFKVYFTVISEGYDGTFDASIYANGHLAGSKKNLSISSGESKRFLVDCIANFPPKIYSVKVIVIDKYKREFSETAKQKLEVKDGGVYSSRSSRFISLPIETRISRPPPKPPTIPPMPMRYNIRITRMEIL